MADIANYSIRRKNLTRAILPFTNPIWTATTLRNRSWTARHIRRSNDCPNDTKHLKRTFCKLPISCKNQETSPESAYEQLAGSQLAASSMPRTGPHIPSAARIWPCPRALHLINVVASRALSQGCSTRGWRNVRTTCAFLSQHSS